VTSASWIASCVTMSVAICTAACAPELPVAQTPAWVSDLDAASRVKPASPPAAATPIADHYREVAARILGAARGNHAAYDKLAELTDTVGHRLAGSPELDKAVAWAIRAMARDGLVVRTEKVMVPHWVRGAERATITSPVARPLPVLGLGGSVPTPKAGVIAQIVVVHDWAELERRRDAVSGAIVLYDAAMPAWTEDKGPGYGAVVEYRTQGAVRAAKLGARAVLVRSLTEHSLHTLHTGSVHYEDTVAKIPAAAVTVEDAELIARLAAKGAVTVELHLDSQLLPDVESANVIGELRGREHPEEIVVIGGHLDSWDVGQGAHDDGAGCVTMMEAAHVLAQLGLAPRRTIRVVLFTNEENGVRGAAAYAKDHADELPRTVLALESDTGGFAPRGFSIVHTDPGAATRMRARIGDIASLLRPLGATRVDVGYAGSDVGPMGPAGVPLLGLRVDTRTYFDIHHTEADTLDKVDPLQVADDAAAVAVLAYIVADLPDRVDAP